MSFIDPWRTLPARADVDQSSAQASTFSVDPGAVGDLGRSAVVSPAFADPFAVSVPAAVRAGAAVGPAVALALTAITLAVPGGP
jgi:hypothetical protein